MERRKEIITLLTICMLLFSTFAIFTRNNKIAAQPSNGAQLTGNIVDSGKDTDDDGKYNYLEVAVEINVSVAGNYRISAYRLGDQYGNSIYLPANNRSYLNEGYQWLNLSYYGIAIYAARFNAKTIFLIELLEFSDYYQTYLGYISDVQLSKTYNYTKFDSGASLTGKTCDEGIDTDGDKLFNSLQVGVEINVTDAATYRIYIERLVDGVSIDVFADAVAYLSSGIQTLNVSVNGAKIYASRGNVSKVSYLYLYVLRDYDQYQLDYKSYCPLNRTYSYNEFDPMAFFTGKILDEGVDEEPDGLFDYLKISVEINVTDAGYYFIYFQNLVDDYYNHIYEYRSILKDFDVGVYSIDFIVYGPKIYGAHINPVYIGQLSIDVNVGWEWIHLEERNMVPLPSLYNYSEFESHAFLTGTISDRGVDTDGDGLFDYLEVGVEVNVTEAGKYGLSVGGLAEITLYKTHQTGYYQYFENDLSLGTHVINFTFPGPMIAYYHINPTHITSITLTEISPYCQLSYTQDLVLTTMYNYTKFNSPLTDMQIEFTVYPNATVGVSGLVNQTHYYAPYYYPPLVNATLGFSTSGDVTTGSVNGTMMLPNYPPSLHQFPFNSTTVNFASKYNNGMLNTQLNATMHLPPEGSTIYPFNSSNFSFHSTYSDEMLNVDLYGDTELPSFILSQFPFEMGDATVLADYKDNEINGNITFHTLSGFPLGDVVVDFNGNKTEISFTGHITVIYGDYFGMKINATILEEMLTQINSTIPGQGEHSLYNMTQGMIECTKLSTTKTPITDPLEGARVDYNVTIHGNFTKLLSTTITQMLFGYWAPEEAYPIVYAALDSTLSSVNQASLTLNYYKSGMATLHITLSDDVKALWSNALKLIPPTVSPLFSTMPPEYQEYYRNLTEALLKIANITAYAVENAEISVDYSSLTQQLNVRTSLTANVTKMKNEIISILPDTVLPQYREFVESCTNTTYCTLESLNITCNYVNSVTSFDAKWLLKGDFTAELNRMKHCYVELLNLTSPYMINWQILMINETEIDISNFKAEFRLGEDWMTLKFEGLKIYPPKDEIDSVRFKLYRLFNITSSSYESPGEFQKLKITIIGGANATHAVLLYAPPTVPSPDNASLDYRVMTWQNTKLSSLKYLVFQIARQEVIHYLGKNYYVPIFTNSTVSDFTYDFSNPNAPSISFNVSGTTGMGFCNITIPRALIDVKTGNWAVLIDETLLPSENFTVTQNDEYVFIYLTYSHSDHTIKIVGTWVVAEFPPNMLPLILVILSFIAAIIAVKQRKKLNKLKTKYQTATHNFARILHQLGT